MHDGRVQGVWVDGGSDDDRVERFHLARYPVKVVVLIGGVRVGRCQSLFGSGELSTWCWSFCPA